MTVTHCYWQRGADVSKYSASQGSGGCSRTKELINAYIGARFFYLDFALITGMCSYKVQVTVSFFHIILIVSKLSKYFF